MKGGNCPQLIGAKELQVRVLDDRLTLACIGPAGVVAVVRILRDRDVVGLNLLDDQGFGIRLEGLKVAE